MTQQTCGSCNTDFLTRPKAILFDWDNTLVNTWGVIHRALAATLRHFGKPVWTEEEVRDRVRASARDSFPRLFGDRWQDAMTVFYQAFDVEHLNGLSAIVGAEDLLKTAWDEEIYLALVSNKNGAYLRKESEYLGWSHFFGAIVGATDAARDKPAVDPVKLALTPSGLDLGPEIWFVGDTDIDVECAHNCGLSAIMITETLPKGSQLDKKQPIAYFHDLSALKAGLLSQFEREQTSTRT